MQTPLHTFITFVLPVRRMHLGVDNSVQSVYTIRTLRDKERSMYYIYDQSTTKILSREGKRYYQEAAYKTMSAAQAALTRM